MTTTHETNATRDIELADPIWVLPEIRYLEPRRLVIAHQSPPPKVEDPNFDICMLPHEANLLDQILAEPEDPTVPGVFVRSLSGEVFANNVKDLE